MSGHKKFCYEIDCPRQLRDLNADNMVSKGLTSLKSYFSGSRRIVWDINPFFPNKISDGSFNPTKSILIFLYTKEEFRVDSIDKNKIRIAGLAGSMQFGNQNGPTIGGTMAQFCESFAKETPGIQKYRRPGE
jgi:hypothetical protein